VQNTDPQVATHTKHDARSQPTYHLAEAARYVKVPTATLRLWALGRDASGLIGRRSVEPLIKPVLKAPAMFSFWNLIEAYVLRGLRPDHKVPLQAVRKAVRYAEKELGIDHLFLRKELATPDGRVFLERYGKLIELSASGQITLEKVFEAHLRRVEWDENSFPIRLFPFVASGGNGEEKPVLIDSRLSFGRPVLRDSSISTRTLVERLDAGESLKDVAADYELPRELVEYAVLYERAA